MASPVTEMDQIRYDSARHLASNHLQRDSICVDGKQSDFQFDKSNGEPLDLYAPAPPNIPRHPQ
jgi:hypothetical protein